MKTLIPIVIGLLVVGCVSTKHTSEGRLTPKEVAEVLAFKVGTWEVRGHVAQAGDEPLLYKATQFLDWKEKGKSIGGTIAGQFGSGPKSYYVYNMEYDQAKGVFIARFKTEGIEGVSEIVSHQTYDPITRTFHIKEVNPEPKANIRVNNTFQHVGKNKCIGKTTSFEDNKLVSSMEYTLNRIVGKNDRVRGAYEINIGGKDERMVLHDNGRGNAFINKTPRRPFIWKTYGKEVHFGFTDGDPNVDFYIYAINPDNSLTYTAVILIDGKRIDELPKEAGHTYKKIK